MKYYYLKNCNCHCLKALAILEQVKGLRPNRYLTKENYLGNFKYTDSNLKLIYHKQILEDLLGR